MLNTCKLTTMCPLCYGLSDYEDDVCSVCRKAKKVGYDTLKEATENVSRDEIIYCADKRYYPTKSPYEVEIPGRDMSDTEQNIVWKIE